MGVYWMEHREETWGKDRKAQRRKMPFNSGQMDAEMYKCIADILKLGLEFLEWVLYTYVQEVTC